MDNQALHKEAIRILTSNRIDQYTVPGKQLYPFQWNWDSGFTCLGLSKFNVDWVIEEYTSLFKGLWKNGLLPHIIFHSDHQDGYFPNASYWKSDSFTHATDLVKTSGITQPPVHGFIFERMLDEHGDHKGLIDMIKRLFPGLLSHHEFLYRERDPHGEGLVYIFHPWESGRDNSPVWDEILARMEVDQSQLPPYQRVDNLLADPSHRPTDDDYMKYVFLMEIGRRNGYHGQEITDTSPFLVQDTLFNAVLIASNESLIRIGKKLNLPTDGLEEKNQLAIKSYRSKLWNDDIGNFVCYDLKAEKQLCYDEIGGVTSLFANIPDESKASRIHKNLKSLITEDELLLYPSFDPNSALFDPKRYWKGPIWPQMNWLVSKGLKKYGYIESSEKVKGDIIKLVSELGFYEYFDPRKSAQSGLSAGYGGNEFSWTSSVILDLTT
ncbi:MAG: trehalase family glycosidase [Bacteroidota bacterium]